jgi:hypothetical protein
VAELASDEEDERVTSVFRLLVVVDPASLLSQLGAGRLIAGSWQGRNSTKRVRSPGKTWFTALYGNKKRKRGSHVGTWKSRGVWLLNCAAESGESLNVASDKDPATWICHVMHAGASTRIFILL